MLKNNGKIVEDKCFCVEQKIKKIIQKYKIEETKAYILFLLNVNFLLVFLTLTIFIFFPIYSLKYQLDTLPENIEIILSRKNLSEKNLFSYCIKENITSIMSENKKLWKKIFDTKSSFYDDPKEDIKKKAYEYIDQCTNGFLLDKKIYKVPIHPKISVIMPVFNKEKYLMRSLRSVQYQKFKNIEIILIDDYSNDNSTIKIENFKKFDRRIKLLKHGKNKGTLISRNDGVLEAKSDFITFLDPDDLLLQNILPKAYYIAIKYNIEIVQFASFTRGKKALYKTPKNHKTSPIYQPALEHFIFYENGYLRRTNWYIWGKLIKRDAFIRALKKIKDFYLKQHMILYEDGLMIFSLFKNSASYKYINNFGYIYFSNNESTTKNKRKEGRENKTMNDIFLYLKFLFEYTKNTEYDKAMAMYMFRYILRTYKSSFSGITKGFEFILNVMKMYLKSPYINEQDKEKIKSKKKKIQKIQNDLSSKKI